MKDGGVAQLAQLFFADSKGGERSGLGPVGELRQAAGEQRHPLRVSRRGGVSLLDRRHGGFDESFEEAPDVLREPAILDRNGGLRGQGGCDFLVLFLEGDGLDLHHGRDADVGHRAALAVQELQHADDAPLGGLHRHDQHRLRAIAMLSVEAVVEPVGGAGRQLPDVGKIQCCAAGRHEASDRGFVERERTLHELKTH